MATSPLAYQYRLTHPLADTPAMRLGRACHTAVLEPDAFPHEYVVWEDGIRRGKTWDAFALANADKTIVTSDEYETALAVRDAVKAHRVASRLLRYGRSEVTLKWVDAETRLRCKARLDHLCLDMLTDLKTVGRSMDARQFGRHATDLWYPCQVAFYRLGLIATGHGAAPVHMIAAEAVPPYDVAVYRVEEDVMDAATEIVHELLRQVRLYRGWKRPPGRCPGVQSLEVPPWFFDGDGDGEAIQILEGLRPEHKGRT
jgi:hypothetical protein